MTTQPNPRAALYSALALAVADANNPRLTATNLHLKNKFADLKEVLATIKPVLAKHGLGVTQLVGGDGTMTEVRTIVFHGATGETLETTHRMTAEQKGVNAAQAAGIAITYMRRYALLAMFAIVGDADGDGDNYEFNAPQIPESLMVAAEGCARQGLEVFARFWKDLSPAERDLLRPETDRLKKLVQAADAKGEAK